MPDQITDPEGGQSQDWSPPDELAGNQTNDFSENVSQGTGPEGPQVQIMRDPGGTQSDVSPAGAGVDPWGAMLPQAPGNNFSTDSTTTPGSSGDVSNPTFQGNGYNFIAPGVAFGTMTPGGVNLGAPGYSWYDKASKSWIQVPKDVGMKGQPMPSTRLNIPSKAPMKMGPSMSAQDHGKNSTFKSFQELQ